MPFLKLIENLQEPLEWDLIDIYYIDGSKDSKLNVVAIYKIGIRSNTPLSIKYILFCLKLYYLRYI